MIKKMMLLAMAVGALLAFAGPAMAQADVLSDSEGDLPIGAEVTATSTDLVTEVPGLPTLECALVTIHGDVVANGPVIEIEETETTVNGCNLPITNPASGDITIGGGVGIASESTFVAAGICHFTGNIPFSYETNSDTLTITGEEQLTSACGNGTMSGSFTLETENEDPIFIT